MDSKAVGDSKRLAILSVYDENGIVDRYLEFYINSLLEVVDRLIIVVNGKIGESDLKKIENYTSGKAKVKILKIDKEKNISRIEITIHEGKNREVRKMCGAISKKVLALHRSKIGDINVKDLKLGTWRYLKKEEVRQLINYK